MNAQSLIRKSITGTITIEELNDLRKVFAEQPELRENLAIERTMYTYRNHRLKEELKSILPGATESKNKTVLLSIITIIAIVFLGYWMYNNGTTGSNLDTTLALHINDRSVSPILLMGDDTNDKKQWSAAANMYAKSEYSEALRLIQSINNPTSEQKIFEGLCLIYKEEPNYKAANKIMKYLQQNPSSLIFDQALWFGALIDLKLKQNDLAKMQLQIIVREDLWKKKEANELLRLLE